MEEIYLMLILVTAPLIKALPEPSYVSEWQTIKAESGVDSEVDFYHNLNDWPVKVDAEVKVHSNDDVIVFPGMGSATADDDGTNRFYGGVLVIYNDILVKLVAPNKWNANSDDGFIVYTGKDGWNGPIGKVREYREGSVRVKVWLNSDFPTPNFMTSWEPISVYDSVSFKEISHNISGYPSFAVVQVTFSSGADTWVFEAQGSSSAQVFKVSSNVGGVVYGFSDTAFRLWYLQKTAAGIYSSLDGWGHIHNIRARSGQYRIMAWKFPSTWVDTIILPADDVIHKKYQYRYINRHIYHLNVEVEAHDGNNTGFRFYGVGSTVNDKTGPYGGLVYGSCDRYVLFWLPSNTFNGHLIQIGDDWGSGMAAQSSDNATIRINYFRHWETTTFSYVKGRQSKYIEQSTKDIVPIDNILWNMTCSYVECTATCINNLNCGSFFYHQEEKLCIGHIYETLDATTTEFYSGMHHFVTYNTAHLARQAKGRLVTSCEVLWCFIEDFTATD